MTFIKKITIFHLELDISAAVLKNKGVACEVYCQDIFHYSNDQLIQYLKRRSYDLICVGFLAARFKETIIDLCSCINSTKKDAWLVLGGHGPTPIPEYSLEKTGADIVVLGEGEETLLDLLKCKINGENLSKIKGIAFRENDKILINERRKPIQNLDSIPFPEWSLFPMDKYINCLKLFRHEETDKTLGLITSRGCINKCNFCYRMERGIRFRSIKKVVEEILFLNNNYGVNYFLMYDELFAYPKKRIFAFQDELEKNDLKIKYTANARVDVFDEEMAVSLKESGCQFLNFGMESSDQVVLDKMNKNTTVIENIQAAEIVKKIGIGLGLNFIWGNLGDTVKSLRGNVDLIKKFNTYDYIRTIRPVTPYPGCDLYYYAIKKGLLTGPDDFFKRFKNSDLLTVNFTDIPDDQFYQILFETNKDLIMDHFSHTTKDLNAANQLIDSFYNLYFKGTTTFRGARHFKR